MQTTRARLRHLAIHAAFFLALALPAMAGVALGHTIYPSPVLWVLGGFLGVLCGVVGLWVLQPVIEGRER